LNRQGGFRLTKWYFDCVSDQGEVAICYCAVVRWRKLSLHYSSLLLAGGAETTTRSSLRRFRIPRRDGDAILLELPGLNLQGIWRSGDGEIRRNLFETDQGSVEWHCLQTRSQATLRVPDRPELGGTGYAECLTLTLPPWELPISQLRWGRFLAAEDSLIWIDWQGSYHKQLILHNGRECVPRAIGESIVSFDQQEELELESSRVLRDGALGQTVLSGAPLLHRIFPAAMFAVHESKWCSQGRLRLADRESLGWAIHELVRWNTP
jgi:hypothetical protein